MRRLTWNEFDQAVLVLSKRFQGHPFTGVHGIPRGGLCLAVALSHALELPMLSTPDSACLVVDEVYETGKTLAAMRQKLPDAVFAVWVSKQPTQWWEAVEVTDRDDWLVFPWENAERAGVDEQAYRQARGLV